MGFLSAFLARLTDETAENFRHPRNATVGKHCARRSVKARKRCGPRSLTVWSSCHPRNVAASYCVPSTEKEVSCSSLPFAIHNSRAPHTAGKALHVRLRWVCESGAEAFPNLETGWRGKRRLPREMMERIEPGLRTAARNSHHCFARLARGETRLVVRERLFGRSLGALPGRVQHFFRSARSRTASSWSGSVRPAAPLGTRVVQSWEPSACSPPSHPVA